MATRYFLLKFLLVIFLISVALLSSNSGIRRTQIITKSSILLIIMEVVEYGSRNSINICKFNFTEIAGGAGKQKHK